MMRLARRASLLAALILASASEAGERIKLDGYILWEARAERSQGGHYAKPKALEWFEENQSTLEPETARLWQRAQLRCRVRTLREPMLLWSADLVKTN